MATKEQLFSITIFGYRKPGMDEDEYHKYVSENHAGCLKGLLAEKKILSYTMQHNSSTTKNMMTQIFSEGHRVQVAECDTVVQIVFRDVQDYINVRSDPHFENVVNPDHVNFADGTRTQMVTGWFEAHIVDGKVV
ncbi:hypothetical protein AJ80_02373 [Polytolypa hystricis UAMH7299]|uniref:EthD domain-containing protein n=1 Tax=Polytolypa hystricis (strain UAMH7299) TaxID=1447883 RepID=A0A2B7YRH3_POLH7|nr:hypothetical protein AJ80_02373 [Polytolypa hystricis UAMH7299]